MTTLIAIKDTLSSNCWKQVQISTTKYWAEFLESFWRKEGGNVWTRGNMKWKPTETADLNSWEIMDPRTTDKKTLWDQPKPSACVWQLYGLVFCKAPSSEIRHLDRFWEPVPHALPCPTLRQGEELCPNSTCINF